MVLLSSREKMKPLNNLVSHLLIFFTNYANNSKAFIRTKDNFIYHNNIGTTANKNPVKYYLCDKNTLLILKFFYGGEGLTKEKIKKTTASSPSFWRSSEGPQLE